MELQIVVPAIKDNINAWENFRKWKHQALIPLGSKSILHLVLTDIFCGLSITMDKTKSKKYKITVLSGTDDVGEKIVKEVNDFRKTLPVLNVPDSNVKINVIQHEQYLYYEDILQVLKHITHSKDKVRYILQFPNMLFVNEGYKMVIKEVMDMDDDTPSLLLAVYLYDELCIRNVKDNVIELGKNYKLVDIFSKSSLAATMFPPFYEYVLNFGILPAPHKDYVVIEHNKERCLGRLLNIFAFNGKFAKFIKDFGNINITGNRFSDFLKYILSVEDIKIRIVIFKDGQFVSLKYPWEILKGLDYISRWTTYRAFKARLSTEKSSSNEEMYVQSLLKSSNRKYVPIVVAYSKSKIVPSSVFLTTFDKFYEANKDKIESLVSNLGAPSYRYTFEDYPYDEKRLFSSRMEDQTSVDAMELLFKELGIRAIIFLPVSPGDDKTEIDDVNLLLENAGVSIEDLNTAFFRGIIFLGNNVFIGSGVHIRNSYIGSGSVIMTNSIVDHSIIGNNTIIYPDSVVTYAILGYGVKIGGNVTFAREKLRGKQDTLLYEEEPSAPPKPCKFFTGKGIVNYYSRFSALVGDDTEIMIGCTVLPGRRIGYKCKIHPNVIVKFNLPPRMIVEAKKEEGSPIMYFR